MKRSFFTFLLIAGLFALFPSAGFPVSQVSAGSTNLRPGGAAALKANISAALVPANFGETSILNADDSGNGNLLVAQQAVLSQAGTLQSLSFYIASVSGRLNLGVYSDSSGNPGALLAQTGVFIPVTGWNTQNVQAPVTLAAGTYWLAFLPEKNGLHFRMAFNGAARWFSVPFGTLPASFSTTPQSGAYHWSFYGMVLVNVTPTNTPTPGPTATNTSIPINSPTPTATNTSAPVNSPTPTATNTSAPVNSPTPTSTPVGTGGSLAFAPKSDFTVGTGPTNAVVGDLDGDGKPDVAVANYGNAGVIGNTISVLKNTGAGGSIAFAPRVDFPTGSGPHGIAMSDLDGDGKPDLVTAQYGAYGLGNTVAVLRNTSSIGSVSFAARLEYTTGTGPHDVAIGDLDGDGKPDLAATNFGDGNGSTVTVFRNTSTIGNIAFAAGQTFTVGSGPYGIAVGDLNGDGKLDIVVGDNGTISGSGTTISVLTNTTTSPGSITFAPKADFLANSGPREVVLGDLDRDGRLDVAVANFGNYNGTTLSIFRNISSGGTLSLAPKVDLAVGPAPHGLAAGDLNGDGLVDLVVTNYGSGDSMTSSVLQNNSTSGTISFAPRLDLTTGAGPHGAAMGDLNGDGGVDIVITDYGIGNSNTISIFQNLTSQPAVTPTPIVLPTIAPSATPTNGPLPTDTPAPVATNTPLPAATATATPIASGGSISFAPKIDFTVGTGPTNAVVGDLNGDGKPDVAAAIYGTGSSNTVSVLLNTSTLGSVSFAPKVDFVVGSGPHQIALGDLDGDGKPDLVVTQYGAFAAGNTITVLLNTSSGGSLSFAAGQTFSVGNGPLGVAIGDLNGDGKPDLAVSNFQDGQGSTVTVLGNTSSLGNITFDAGQAYATGVGPYGVAIGDLDGDGKPDLVIGNNGSLSGSGTTVSVLRNTSTGSISFAPKVDFPVNSGPRQVLLRDLDGDGKLDVAVTNFGNYNGVSVSILRNTSSGSLSLDPKIDLPVGPAPHGLAAGDFDRDGKADLAVANFGSGNGTTVSALQNNSAIGIISFAARLDLPSSVGPIDAATGDLDGDGKLDIVVTNYGTGGGNTVSVLLNQSP